MTPLKRRTRLRAMSAKRRRDLEARALVREHVLARDYGCRVAVLLPDITCHGRLEVHEVVPRARDPHAWLDPSKCIAVCSAHHRWVTAHPEQASRLGAMSSWFPLWQLCSVETCLGRVGAHTTGELEARLADIGWVFERRRFDTEAVWYCPNHTGGAA